MLGVAGQRPKFPMRFEYSLPLGYETAAGTFSKIDNLTSASVCIEILPKGCRQKHEVDGIFFHIPPCSSLHYFNWTSGGNWIQDSAANG